MYKAKVTKTANVSDRLDQFAEPGTCFGDCLFDFSQAFADGYIIGYSLTFMPTEPEQYWYQSIVHLTPTKSFLIKEDFDKNLVYEVTTSNSVYLFENIRKNEPTFYKEEELEAIKNLY